MQMPGDMLAMCRLELVVSRGQAIRLAMCPDIVALTLFL